MPVTIVGLPELIRKLDGRYLIAGPLAQTIKECGEEVKKAVQARTPILIGHLHDSIALQTWPTLAKVSTDVVYGYFIERGQRKDPRVRGGVVYRRAGAARMFRYGLQDAQAIIKAKMSAMSKLIEARFSA